MTDSLEKLTGRLERGLLFVLSGPSGAGKGTVLAQFISRHPFIGCSVSTTTRAARDGERDGVHYNFVSVDKFDQLVADGQFLEWARVHGNRYGTTREQIEAALAEGRIMFLEIDIQGGMSVKEQIPEAVLVFVLPSVPEQWVDRLRKRGSETEESLRLRVKAALEEIRIGDKKYDYLVRNDELQDAVDELEGIVRGEMCRFARTSGEAVNRYEEFLRCKEV